MEARRMSLSLSKTPEDLSRWFVYIAQAHTGRYYVGIATEPLKRVMQHNKGSGAKFARDQGPFNLVYVSPSFGSKSEARKREVQLKGWSRAKKSALVEQDFKRLRQLSQSKYNV